MGREGTISMANEPADMIMPMLREMRSEMNERFSRVEIRLGRVEQKLEKIEDAQKNVRQALVADTMMSRLIAGDFEERIAALEINVEALTKGK
jgi:hypothetical protein